MKKQCIAKKLYHSIANCTHTGLNNVMKYGRPRASKYFVSACSEPSKLVGVASFRKHWETVLRKHGVPEPGWSVRWIVEHVMGGGMANGRVSAVRG